MPKLIQNVVGSIDNPTEGTINFEKIVGQVGQEPYINVGRVIIIIQDLRKAITAVNLFNQALDAFTPAGNATQQSAISFGIINRGAIQRDVVTIHL